MLPNTITLTDGVTPEVFQSPKRTPNGVVYVSGSPNGDIQGAPSLRVETSRTSKGIERSIIQLQRPLWDAAKGAYVYFTTVNFQVNRHATLNTEIVHSDLMKVSSVDSSVLMDLAAAQL